MMTVALDQQYINGKCRLQKAALFLSLNVFISRKRKWDIPDDGFISMVTFYGFHKFYLSQANCLQSESLSN